MQNSGHQNSHSGALQEVAQHRYRNAPLSRSPISCERRFDETIVLRALDPPVEVTGKGFSSFVSQWAQTIGGETAFAERDSSGCWRKISWLDFERQMHAVAVHLAEIKIRRPGPLMILSGNSIEQAIVSLAAEYVGMAVAPVSQNYSLQTASYTRLKHIFDLVEPAFVFVQSSLEFSGALNALAIPEELVISVENPSPRNIRWSDLIQSEATVIQLSRIEQVRMTIRSNDTARIFFTSGSTGEPKGVPLSYEVMDRICGQARYVHQNMLSERLVVLDWLPWSHAFAGLGNLGRLFALGGTYYIDGGRPIPGKFEQTLKNLREISPTMYATVPAAWTQLSAALESDDELSKKFFLRLRYVSYGGASLSRDVWERFQAVARKVAGEQIVFTSGFGSTETAAAGVNYNRPEDDVGNIGIPNPGVEVKLVPLDGDDGRYEVRMRGKNVFKGYLKRPDLTEAAFDDEGFYCLGDAVHLVDPHRPESGLRYAGRSVEDFKLSTGTWVRVGSVRLALIEQCTPLFNDAVICGHDRDYVAALVWPNIAACRSLDSSLAELESATLLTHPIVLSEIRKRLEGHPKGATSRGVARLILMADPASIDGGEIGDKGYINQAATRKRRFELVERIYSEPPGEGVIVM